ncbi:hypothetical protein [Enterobacter bugandensis]|uniref:hypothetical protein n=1 Tax=Enterobacter bugandensis TaxID=881260 RepID=UPI002FCF3B08
MEDWKFNVIYSGTPQGGVVSQILANIYLQEMDQFLEQKKEQFNNGKYRDENPQYGKLTRRMYRQRVRAKKLRSEGNNTTAKAVLKKVREIKRMRVSIPSKDEWTPIINV